MKAHALLRNGALACALAVACGVTSAAGPVDPLAADAQALITTAPGISVATLIGGLNNPRGIRTTGQPLNFGVITVAEGGVGGSTSTAGRCRQVAPPIGPYTGSRTGGRITNVFVRDLGGFIERRRLTLTDQLPSSMTSAGSGSLVSGVADTASVNGVTYALISGAGCSHGVIGRDNAIVRFEDRNPILVANLGAWLRANPGNQLGPDVEPDGTWYDMVAYNNNLWMTEPNHGLFVRVNPATGAISRVLDVSDYLNRHAVPTALARHKGYFYIGTLGTFPIVAGAQRVYRVLFGPPRLQVVASGTAIVGLAFGADDAMYILQMSGPGEPTPGTGSIVRVRPGGARTTIVSGLTFPTAMVMGPDNALYVSHIGFGPPMPGSGQILRVQL